MCLVLEFDNGKVVSIADKQTDRQMDKATQYGISIYSRNTRLRWDFSCPPGELRLRRRYQKKKKKIWGAYGAPNFGRLRCPFSGVHAAPHSFKNFCRVIRIPNMSLVLRLYNEKVVSIANEQTDVTSSTVLVYRCLIIITNII